MKAEARRSPATLAVMFGLIVLGFVVGQITTCSAHHETRGAAPSTSGTSASLWQPHDLPSVPPGADGEAAPATRAAVDGVSASVRVDRTAVLARGDGRVYVQLTLDAAREAKSTRRVPTDFIVVLDRSGSMQGDKLRFAKEAARELIARMDDADRFSLITYDTHAEQLFTLSRAGLGNRARWADAIAHIRSGSSTNLSAGLDLALRELQRDDGAGRARKVMVLSDGLANVGDVSPRGLRARAQKIVNRGAVVATMGIGDDFDEGLMNDLARSGEGNFYYLAKLHMLSGFLEAELSTSANTVANRVAVHFVPGPYVGLREASGYPLERSAGEVTFYPGPLYAGQSRVLWLALDLPTDRLQTLDLGSVRVELERDDERKILTLEIADRVACVDEVATFERSIVKDVWAEAVLRERRAQVEQDLAQATERGDAALADEIAASYREAHYDLAQRLRIPSVQRSVAEVRKRADTAKKDIQAPEPERKVSAKRARARAPMMRVPDGYLLDPYDAF